MKTAYINPTISILVEEQEELLAGSGTATTQIIDTPAEEISYSRSNGLWEDGDGN